MSKLYLTVNMRLLFALAREAIEVREQVRDGIKLIRKYQNRGRKTYGLPLEVLNVIAELVDARC